MSKDRAAGPEPRWARTAIGLFALSVVACAMFGVFEQKARPASPYAHLTAMPVVHGTNGIAFQAVHLPGGHDARVIWIYTPPHPPGQRLPCVFIAPDSATGYYGKALYPVNQREQWPYAKAGFVVVAYSVDGSTTDLNSNEVVTGIERFRAAHCGVDNERAAVDYALANLPYVDPKRLYVAGHSSGGTMALMAASHDPRIAGCVVYAPACDVRTRVNRLGALEMALRVPGFESFLTTCSPIEYTSTLRCPVFLFHADNDGNVPRSDVETYLAKLRRTNANVVYSRVPLGGHLVALFTDGLPRGIAWLKKLSGMATNGSDQSRKAS